MAVASPHSAWRVAPDGSPARRATEPRAPRLLLLALAACLLYAGFADGATDLPQESWLQLGLAVIATVACAGWLYGNGLRLHGSRLGWLGLALLAAFAAWTALTIAWSVTPERSWGELNRAVAYVLAVLVGLVLGSSLDRAAERVGMAIALAAVPVALYALGAKTLPGLHVGPLNLDHAVNPTRLKEPLGYWNALALVCVCGLLPLLRVAADPWRRARPRVAALLGVLVLVLVIGLTYSRGGVIALAAGLIVLVALSTERLRTVVLFAAALLASAVPLAVALGSDDLTTNGLPLAQRSDDALRVLIALLVVAIVLGAFGRGLIALEARGRLTGERGRRVGRPLALVAGVLVVLVLVGALASGAVGDAVATFKDPKQAAGVTDPNRLLSSTSGNRWTWWNEAAGAWSAKPVAGWGAGSFAVTHLLYRKQLLAVSQPHSVPLQWLAETGLIGLLLAAGGLLALLAAGLARVRSQPWGFGSPTPPPARGASAALLAVAVAWSVHAFYDWDWDIPAVTLPMLFCLGVLAARPHPEPATPRGARGPALVGAGVALVLLAVSVVLPALAQTRTSAALQTAGRDAPTEQQLADAAADAELASRLNPLAVEPLYAAANVAEQRGRVEEARAALLQAVQRQPDAARAWIELARLDFQRQDRSALLRETRRALELDPINPGTLALARRAPQSVVLPYESATATGTPLATQVAVPAPPAPTPPPAPPKPKPPKPPKPAPASPTPPPPAPTPTPTAAPSPTPTPSPGNSGDGRLPPPRTSGDTAPTPEP